MKLRIEWVSPLKFGLCAAALGFFLSYPVIGVMRVFEVFGTRPKVTPFPYMVLIFGPLTVFVFVFVFACIGTATYNILARVGLCVTVRCAPSSALNENVPPSGPFVS